MTVTLTALKTRFREEGTLGKEGRRNRVGELLREREREIGREEAEEKERP